jgi:hypothetical protein
VAGILQRTKVIGVDGDDTVTEFRHVSGLMRHRSLFGYRGIDRRSAGSSRAAVDRPL